MKKPTDKDFLEAAYKFIEEAPFVHFRPLKDEEDKFRYEASEYPPMFGVGGDYRFVVSDPDGVTVAREKINVTEAEKRALEHCIQTRAENLQELREQEARDRHYRIITGQAEPVRAKSDREVLEETVASLLAQLEKLAQSS